MRIDMISDVGQIRKSLDMDVQCCSLFMTVIVYVGLLEKWSIYKNLNGVDHVLSFP